MILYNLRAECESLANTVAELLWIQSLRWAKGKLKILTLNIITSILNNILWTQNLHYVIIYSFTFLFIFP